MKPLRFTKTASPAAKPKADKAGFMDAKQYAKHAAAKREEAKAKHRKGRRK